MRRVLLVLALCGLALTTVLLVSLAPHLASSSELVRLRNAMLYQPQPAEFDWPPGQRPEDFSVDTGPAMSLFSSVVERHSLRQADDWSTALSIARHLLSGGKRSPVAIQSDLQTTYEAIVGKGHGYCGDYADVFTALAYAAGLHVRSWAFSFDGFGGHGHIFNEVWDSSRRRWVAMDLQNNQIFVGSDGQPLSAMDVRKALARGTEPRLELIRADAAPGYRNPAKYFDYYRRGLPEWYLWWGSAVQTLDRSALVRAASVFGRAAEHAAAIASQVHPRIRALHLEENRIQREKLQSLRLRIIGLLSSAAATLLLGLGLWVTGRQRRA